MPVEARRPFSPQCTSVQCLLPLQAAVVGKGKHGGHRRPPSASRLNPAPASVAEGASPSAAVAAKRRSSKAAAAAPTPKRQRRAEEAGAVAETTEAAAASPEAAAPAPKAAKAAKQRAGPKGSSLERGAYGEAARFLKELQKGGMAAVVPQWDKMDAACSGFDEQVGRSAVSTCLHSSWVGCWWGARNVVRCQHDDHAA